MTDLTDLSPDVTVPGRGAFLAKFSGMFIFSIDSYNRDPKCSKSITKVCHVTG